MIPKIIHYVWVGNIEIPVAVVKQIEQWKIALPDYEFKFWGNDDFDVSTVKFAQDMYDAQKWAFVSDVIRIAALKQDGGIYLDTDNIIQKNFDDILDAEFFVGRLTDNYINTGVIASEAEGELINELWDVYVNKQNSLHQYLYEYANNAIVTRYLMDKYPNYKFETKQTQRFGRNIIFEKSYFTVPKLFKQTYVQHMFAGSWIKTSRLKLLVRNVLVKIIGSGNMLRYFNYRRKPIIRKYTIFE